MLHRVRLSEERKMVSKVHISSMANHTPTPMANTISAVVNAKHIKASRLSPHSLDAFSDRTVGSGRCRDDFAWDLPPISASVMLVANPSEFVGISLFLLLGFFFSTLSRFCVKFFF